MKHIGKISSEVALLAAVAAGALVSGCATLEENMAASKKANLVPGKQLSVAAEGDKLVFCEVALITGTSKANAIADFYNSTGTDICTPEKFAGLDKAKIKEETGAKEVFLNPSRRWTFDQLDVFEDGIERTFGGIKMTWMGVVPVEELEKGRHQGPLRPWLHLSEQPVHVQEGPRDLPPRRARRRGLRDAVVHQLQAAEGDPRQRQESGQRAHVAAGLEVPLRGPRSRPDRQPEADQRHGPRLPGRHAERLPGLGRRQGIQLRSITKSNRLAAGATGEHAVEVSTTQHF